MPPGQFTGGATGANINPASQYSPDYVDFSNINTQSERKNTQILQGHYWNRGAVLTRYIDDVPMEILFGINNERSLASRSPQLPLFRYISVGEGSPLDNAATESIYANLKNSLSPQLQAQLDANNALPFEERDPDLMALDDSLQFSALITNYLNSLTGASATTATAEANIASYLNLPDAVSSNLQTFNTNVANYVQSYLDTMGHNDPSYDILANAVSELRGATSTINNT